MRVGSRKQMPSLIDILHCASELSFNLVLRYSFIRKNYASVFNANFRSICKLSPYIYQATLDSFNDVMVHSLVWLGRNHLFSMIIVVRQEGEQ